MLPPLSSPPSPLPEASKGFGQAPISPPESHKSSNAPPPKASQPSLPPLPNVAAPPPSISPIGDVADPPPADSAGSKAPAGEPIVSVPNAPGNDSLTDNYSNTWRALLGFSRVVY